MKRTKEQRLKKYWQFKINPITGWFEDSRKGESTRNRKRYLDLSKEYIS
jgi:hypothetical protein